VIQADCARPESISYLKRKGLQRITGVKKWSGSVIDGIEFIKSFDKIVIHPQCENTISEFRLYSYKIDRRTGDILPDVEDANNHIIDAIRYSLSTLIKKEHTGLNALMF
jgi:phage terminase large subunit